jgi:DNA-binding CsgD family transcriptional regulator
MDGGAMTDLNHGRASSGTRPVGLEAAREAYRRRDWVAARTGLLAAQSEAPLDADDLFLLADCAWWLGDLDAALPALQEAHRRYLDAERPADAAVVALNVAYTLGLRGDEAQSSGWMSRAQRLLAGLPEGPGHGYLAYIDFESAFHGYDLEAALGTAQRIQDLGQRCGDPTLMALGVLGQGRVLIKQGQVDAGMSLLDEAMLAAVSDELEPGWAGNIYCNLMEACHEIADLKRAGDWTQATADWCEQMPGAGPFLGICRIHRAQVLQMQGDWATAEREVLRVCDELAHFAASAVAEAHYLLGDVRRQHGDRSGAEAAFREAHRLGRDPQPGLALLRLAASDGEAAAASIRSALTAAGPDRLARGHLLPAAVEIALATGDLDLARASSEELTDLASTYRSVGFTAESLHARGAVLLAEGDAAAALPLLRDAIRHWRTVGARCKLPRVRDDLAAAYDALGDHDAARLERAAARSENEQFRQPGTAAAGGKAGPAGLTEREAEVLSLVAAGRTNQQIAAELVLSIRTVERHLATVYQKLGVSGRSARAAAVSFAHREGLLTSS